MISTTQGILSGTRNVLVHHVVGLNAHQAVQFEAAKYSQIGVLISSFCKHERLDANESLMLL